MSHSLPSSTQALVDALIKKGGTGEGLLNTNVYTVRYRGKDLHFIGDIPPIVPFSYGIFAGGEDYLKAIFKQQNIAYNPGIPSRYKVFITSSGFIGVRTPQPTDKTINQLATVKSLDDVSVMTFAQRVLDSFPAAPYISFECSKSKRSPSVSAKYIVSSVSFSLEDQLNQDISNDTRARPALDVIVDLFDVD